ncbi:MAG TPA: hypothetical protein VFI52_06135 [Gemmatimonadaceae bacterium]|nr:hypothetical protein [Gemmatimonadaceae bacterium]
MQATSLKHQLLFIAALLAGCGRSDRAPSADSSRAGATARSLSAAPGRARAYPGALTKPIDDYSGDELYELTRNLHYAGSHERQRVCRNAPGCEGTAPTQRTLVQVSAVATQDSLGVGDVPTYGVVYLRAINRGNAEEARYGLRPGKSLRYYMIVQRDSANGLRWRLEELETTSPRRHAQVAVGRINGCGHPWTPGARADFKTCADAERSDTVVTLPLTLRAAVDAPMWIACEMGCCEFVQ